MIRHPAKGNKKDKTNKENQDQGGNQVYKKTLSRNEFKHSERISEKIEDAI